MHLRYLTGFISIFISTSIFTTLSQVLQTEDIPGGFTCHNTYNADSPLAEGIGGCEDEASSGMGSLYDLDKIYDYAKSKGFMIMGGGGNGYRCFDQVTITRQGRTATVVVLDNGSPKDIAIPVYSQLTGITGIGKNCEGANARLQATLTVVGNLKQEYITFTSVGDTTANIGNGQSPAAPVSPVAFNTSTPATTLASVATMATSASPALPLTPILPSPTLSTTSSNLPSLLPTLTTSIASTSTATPSATSTTSTIMATPLSSLPSNSVPSNELPTVPTSSSRCLISPF